MKYSKEGSRVFVPYQYDKITTENIKEACKTFFCDHHLLIFQLQNRSFLYQNGPNSTLQNTVYSVYWFSIHLKQNIYVSKYSQSTYNPDLSKIPKYSHPHITSSSAASLKRVEAKSQIKSLSIFHMLWLVEPQKKERQADDITIESFDVCKKEWMQ